MANHDMSSVIPRHDPSYKLDLPGNLRIRWSTEEDRPGMALTAAIAFGDVEGAEHDGNVLISWRMAHPDYFYGSCRWAICVATDGPRKFTRTGGPRTRKSSESTLTDLIRESASQSLEPVLAILSYHLLEWRISGHPIKVAKHCLVASRPSCRVAGGGSGGIMKEMFAMCQARAVADHAAFFHVQGIPNYYRAHGFEQALRFGNGFKTVSPPAPSSLSSMFHSREGVPADAPPLYDSYDALSATSPLWMSLGSRAAVMSSIEWATGKRGSSFPAVDHRHLPCLVIEEAASGRPVAGVFWYMRNEDDRPISDRLAIIAVIYSPTANIQTVAKEVVERAWFFQQKLVADEEDSLRKKGLVVPVAPTSPRMTWRMSKDFPLMKAAEGQGLVVAVEPGSVYSLPADSYISIPSLLNFVEELRPVLQARLAAAKAQIGLPTTSIRISTYSSSYVGCIMHIKEGKITALKAWAFTSAEIIAFSQHNFAGLAEDKVPNVIGPYNALVKLLMGYASLPDIRKVIPDLSVVKDVLPTVEALFPVLDSVTLHYG